MDAAIIDAWERRRVREDDDAYEGRISLGPPNDVAAAYEREDQRAAVDFRPSGRRSGSLNGQHIPPVAPPRRQHTEGRGGVNLQPASHVVTRGLSAAAAAMSVVGVAGRTRGGKPVKNLPKRGRSTRCLVRTSSMHVLCIR